MTLVQAQGCWQSRGQDKWVLVSKEAESHRLYNRGGFGRPLTEGKLQLHPLEALYLIEQGRLLIAGSHPERVIEEGNSPRMGAYRDLRSRGLVVKPAEGKGPLLRTWARGEPTRGRPAQYHVHPVEEGMEVDLDLLFQLAEEAAKRGQSALAGVEDEEGGLTYYGLSRARPEGGQIEPFKPTAKAPAELVDLRFKITDREAVPALELAGFGKQVGLGYCLSLLEGAYLMGKGQLQIEGGSQIWSESKADQSQPDFTLRLVVYGALRELGYLPKTGFKFGTHFRVYDKPLGQQHAPWLVQVYPKATKLASWSQLARMVRLAHGVRKGLWLARHDEGKNVKFLEVAWVKP